MPQYRDIKNFLGGLNRDDSPEIMPEGDYPDLLNMRTGSSSSQKELGHAETLQGEIDILINVTADLIYYGNSIGGNFVYPGFESVIICNQEWMKKNWDADYPGSKVYGDVEANRAIYGGLYTHAQIMSADFCPAGWRVPTEAEFQALIDCCGANFDDWFLPSLEELRAMYEELYLVGTEFGGVGKFSSGFQWSSSENDVVGPLETPSNSAYTIPFISGVAEASLKYGPGYVRACRSFTTSTIYALRDEGPAGGLIFYIINNGGGSYTYYEAAPFDQPYEAWSNVDNVALGNTGTAIGTGEANTANIIAQAGHLISAAKSCSDLVYGGTLKEAGLAHWLTPNTGGEDQCGFRGLPGGGFGFETMYYGAAIGENLVYDLIFENGMFWMQDEGVALPIVCPVVPVASAASSVTPASFVANWGAADRANNYRLDVSIFADFSVLVEGYDNKNVGNVLSATVTGLSANTAYKYRVRAENEICTTENSSTIDVSTSVHYDSVEKSGSFIRNDCTGGYDGSTVSYVVDAGDYTSLISQADADAQAQADVDANGQAYANSTGTCSTVYYNVVKTGSFTRNNCLAGHTGTTVTYTVAAGTYESIVSQAAADAEAQNDVNANGQAYANAVGTCSTIYYNVLKSGSYTRNNCGAGYTGSVVVYTVAAGTYSSLVSQAAADALAQADVVANGQANANTLGTCTATIYYSIEKSGSFTRNDCEAGYTGSTALYVVAAGSYTSTVSQVAADALAQADVNANGQAYVNAIGACLPDMEYNYGYLYNWYAGANVRNIANIGWRMPTSDDWYALALYLDPTTTLEGNPPMIFRSALTGGLIKETGLTYWASPNAASNATNFNARGSGYRYFATGAFTLINQYTLWWTISEYAALDNGRNAGVVHHDTILTGSFYYKNQGYAIRLIKETTTLTHGQTGTYVGNDGKVYATICIGTQEWISANLKETRYRDMSLIPVKQSNAEWVGLTDGALCVYVI